MYRKVVTTEKLMNELKNFHVPTNPIEVEEYEENIIDKIFRVIENTKKLTSEVINKYKRFK